MNFQPRIQWKPDVLQDVRHPTCIKTTAYRPESQRKKKITYTVADLSVQLEMGHEDDSDFVLDYVVIQKLVEEEPQGKDSEEYIEE